MTAQKASAKIDNSVFTPGHRVWVAYEETLGTVISVDEHPANGVNVLLDSDRMVVSCAVEQLTPANPGF